MALTSVGSEITIIDESQYLPASAGPIPLIIAPSAQDKINPSGTGTATGTTASNANKVQLVTSQRELATNFGVPNFIKVNGAIQQGNELNEYGLLAAYSFLGVASQAYIMRPDVDLAQLEPSAGAPTGVTSSGTYWLDLTETSWGLLEWNATDEVFSVVAPTLITDSADMSAGFPKSSFGKAGDYAVSVTTTTLKAFYKGARTDRANNWVLLGSDDWKSAHTTIEMTGLGTLTSGTVKIRARGAGSYQTITTGTSASAFVSAINADTTLAAFMTAVLVGSGTIQIFSEQDVDIGSAGTASLTALGLTATIYGCPNLWQNKHTQVPSFKTGTVSNSTLPRATGSVWFKTTSPNNGANFVAKKMGVNEVWASVVTPLYSGGLVTPVDDNQAAIAALATDGVDASTIPASSLYARYNTAANNTWQVTLQKWGTDIPLSVTGDVVCTTGGGASPTFGNGVSFDVIVAGVTYTVELDTVLGDEDSVDGFITAFSRANIPNMQMTLSSAGYVSITHLQGNDFALKDDTDLSDVNPLALMGIVGDETDGTLYSNWSDLTYTASESEPRVTPVDSTLWYHSVVDEVDIMVHDGSNWVGYLNEFASTDPAGPTVGATEPETQSDGTQLVANDIWIDTSDLENYPVIKRYTSAGAWETLDNTDQTTESGVLFADARYRVNGTSTGSSDIVDLLSSDYVDLDSPDPDLYPKGMLLFNLRRSGYNVKEYKINYFNSTDFANLSLPAFKNAWVSKVSTASDGSPYMGRKAQRRVIVEAMQAGLNASLEARQEQNDFTLIACPGYPELLDEMVTLNTDRKGTAFILTDPPMRLQPTGAALKDWATNANGAPTNGEEGLVTLNEYSAVFYPNAYTSNLTGEDVMVPASHIMLRTIALNDQVAYPWFAPAGLRRGVVNNATSVGYLNSSGEFVPSPLGQGVRDVMYTYRMNPIVIQPTGGVVVWGQKTLAVSASALDRINVARLIVYIRKQLEILVKPFFFEPNDTLTRNEAKQVVESFFNELVGLRALYDFLVVCDTSNNTPERIDRNELWIDIAIKPVKAIEFIYIPIRIKNTGEALA